MDRTPDGGLSDSISHYDFSADEIEVATILTHLKFLIPRYDFRNCGFLPSLWGSKRLRTACKPNRKRTESVVAIASPVISCGGNVRNISPDSPLLLKASPANGGGVQGRPSIVVEPTGEKELTPDPSSATRPQPHDGVHASPSSPLQPSIPKLLFDLNLPAPDCSGIQSPLPNEDGTPHLPPSLGEEADNGSNKAEATGDMQGEMPQGCCIGHQGTEPRFRQVQ